MDTYFNIFMFSINEKIKCLRKIIFFKTGLDVALRWGVGGTMISFAPEGEYTEEIISAEI